MIRREKQLCDAVARVPFKSTFFLHAFLKLPKLVLRSFHLLVEPERVKISDVV